ncbi:FRG domain-containing protein [Pseudomonas sp. R16(2017)]|uniref:FRG domain-containing protein n=1 Tax=Pseudomonas sp. R16(2017) TaxID=1981704 RepID=UPI000A1EE8FD|nr:FRG domain-containing protein [Pseudomonas sp. R16(2017)]
MQNICIEKKYETAVGLLNDLLPWSKVFNLKDYVFRGHANADFQLVPTSVRLYGDNKIGKFRKVGVVVNGLDNDSEYSLAVAEYKLLRDFYRKADSLGLDVPRSDILRDRLYQEYDSRAFFKISDGQRWLPIDMLESAGLAQHYGIPTRLLDWTYDPFVAAFFASLSSEIADGNICVWAFNTMMMGTLTARDLNCPLNMVTPHYGGNPNLAAQKGLFTHWAKNIPLVEDFSTYPVVDRRPLDELIQGYLAEKKLSVCQPIFIKMLLPDRQVPSLAVCLRDLGYGPAKMFPGYSGVAAELLDLEKMMWER